MFKVLVIDSSAEDTEWLRGLLEEEGAQVVVCRDGIAARPVIEAHSDGFAAVFKLWDVSDPAFAETLALLRHRWPDTPVVVTIQEFTPELAPKALALKVKGVLQKPLEAEKVIASYRGFLPREDSQMIARLRERIHGRSARLQAALRQLSNVIQRADSNVLLLGETGTGKELFARAIHDFGPRPDAPFVAAQVSAIPEHLFESQMFGHEKGAFTSAEKQHIGFFEQAEDGTLFLDEIGDLSAPAQIRLLRVIQERKFRRLNGKEELPFNARLICATHHDLPKEARRNEFRHDLYQRISEEIIHLPPLRERKGDIEAMARLFLDARKVERRMSFADETLKILCGYPFPGNVRELENVVKSALMACEGEIILPQHLPMQTMNDLLTDPPITNPDEAADAPRPGSIEPLIDELARSLPSNWLTLAYREASRLYNQAFDRIYLRRTLDRYKHNLTAAAKAANLDPKTFRNYWRQSGLPPLKGEEEKPEG